MSKRFLAFSAALLAVSVIAPVAAKDAKDQGFSGKWVMDKKTSHGSEPMAELRQDIKKKKDDIVVQSRFSEPANGIAPLVYLGIMTSALRLKSDGQELTNQVGPYAQTTKTTVDGNTMTTDWASTINGDLVKGKWVRTLSEDGKHMTLEITESSTKGQQGQATINFNRK